MCAKSSIWVALRVALWKYFHRLGLSSVERFPTGWELVDWSGQQLGVVLWP